jgi:Mrp family chromosome partitioning ATPase
MVLKMADGEPQSSMMGGSPSLPAEQPIEVRRHLAAVRRSWLPLMLFVVIATTATYFLTSMLPDSYRSTATIVQADAVSSLGSSDVESLKRRLETINRLLTTTTVLERAARSLPGETAESIDRAISATVDPGANIIEITAEHEDPRQAAAIANSVARSLLVTQAAAESQGIATARARLTAELSRLRARGAPDVEIQALRDRISELTIAEATIGSDLRLAERGEVAAQPFAPRPLRNAVVAAFAALFLALVFVIGRDMFRPRLTEPRELAQLMRLPVLATVPIIGRRRRRKSAIAQAVAEEAFQTLQASVRYSLGDDGGRVVLVTSAIEGEGKTTTAVGLAKALARIGQRTLLVCADFRLPTLHEHFGVPRAPGLSDVLRMAGMADDTSELAERLSAVTHSLGPMQPGELGVVASGSRADDPAALLFGGPLDSLLSVMDELEYDFIIFDGPPLLGVADGHALAQRADALLIAARLDRLSVEHAVEARSVLDRLGASAIGLVIGARWRQSAYAYSYTYAQSAGRRDPTPLSDLSRVGATGVPAAQRRRGASRRPR